MYICCIILIDQAPENDVTSLTTYTTHTHASDTRIYIYIYINIHRTRGKAIIGMALRAIKTNHYNIRLSTNDKPIFYVYI